MKRTLLLATVAVAVAALLLHGQTNPPANVSQNGRSEADQIFQKQESDWATAVKQRDVEKLSRFEAEEFEFTGPAGQIWTKASQLETIRAGDLEIDSFEVSELKARLYGDTAVVRFRIVWNGRFRGADLGGPQRVTDVFVKRDGRWQCVASHATRIAAP
jgi:ketosteroid isomerase-like protein